MNAYFRNLGRLKVLLIFALGILTFWNLPNSEERALSINASADGTRSSNNKYDRYFEPGKGAPVYYVKALFTNFGRTTFRYEELPSGAIRLFDASDKMEYVITQPIEIREGRYPDLPEDVIPEEAAKKITELTKRYLITSYATAKGWRYSTFKYEISGNGSVQFWNLGTKSHVSLTPPYVIEEKLCGEGVKPYGPAFTDTD